MGIDSSLQVSSITRQEKKYGCCCILIAHDEQIRITQNLVMKDDMIFFVPKLYEHQIANGISHSISYSIFLSTAYGVK